MEFDDYGGDKPVTDDVILPPRTFQGGFWGTLRRKNHDVQAIWEAACQALTAAFDLTPAESRDFLDSPAGRVLADDLEFIEGGPTGAKAIAALIAARLEDDGWCRWYGYALAAARGAAP